MKKGYAALAVLGIIGVIGIGFTMYVKKQISLLKEYCYKISDFKIINLEKDNITLGITILIQNNSAIDAIIEGFNFDIYLNGTKVSKVVNNVKQKFLANNITKLNIIIPPIKNQVCVNVL